MREARNLRKLGGGLAAACACLGAPALSQAEITTMISGYGTVGLTSINKSDLEFRSSWNQSKGAGTKPDFGVDTRFGVQGVVRFNQQFSATAQVLAQRKRVDKTDTSNDDLNASFEWIFGQYSPISNLDLRAGRVVLPAFMISDSRNVGYSQPWVRAPLEVYAGMPLTTLDGVQVLWRIPVKDAIVTIQPSYGRSTANVQISGLNPQTGQLVSSPLKERSKEVKSLNISLEWGDWLFRVGQVRAEVPLTFAPITERLMMKDKFTGAGLQYDNGKAVVMAEWAQRREPNTAVAPFSPTGTSLVEVAPGFSIPLLNNDIWAATPYAGKPLIRAHSWYVGGGWRFGKFLPMLVYGRAENDLDNRFSTHSVNASVRYDWLEGVAVKAQIGRYQSKDGSAFVMPDLPSANRKVMVFSFALDFVF